MTEFFRGIESAGERRRARAAHSLDADGDAPIAEIAYPVADDQTARYAEASGDHFAIHLDDEFARSVGLPGRIVHGLCTMALAGRAVLEAAGVADPRDGGTARCPLLRSPVSRRDADDARLAAGRRLRVRGVGH